MARLLASLGYEHVTVDIEQSTVPFRTCLIGNGARSARIFRRTDEGQSIYSQSRRSPPCEGFPALLYVTSLLVDSMAAVSA